MASLLDAAQPPPDEADDEYYEKLLDETARTKDALKIEEAVKHLSSENILTPEEYEQVIDIIKGPTKKAVRDYLQKSIDDNAELKGMYSLDKALALWIYTLQRPPVYQRVSRVMTASVSRLTPTGEFTAAVKACLVYIKFVDRALAGLAGAGFLIDKLLWRGMPFKDWESGANVKFTPGRSFHWFEMKSTSTERSVADTFGGNSGTIFRIKPIEAYNIKLFSSVESEEEVVLRPLSLFRVDVESPHHSGKADPVEIHLTQEHSMRYVVMYGDLGTGKTTCFQTATDNFTVGTVSSGLESVIAYNEAQTKDGKFTVRDVPGKGAIEKQDEHVDLQLEGLSKPNHALICTIDANERVEKVAGPIHELLILFQHKPGIAFLITKCDKIAMYRRAPQKWEKDMREAILKKTEGHVKSTQLLFTSNMDPECDNVDSKDKPQVIQWQRKLVAKWQDTLCNFIKANAQTWPKIYVSLDLSAKARAQVDNFINTTCGKGPWVKIFKDLKEELWAKYAETLQALENLGARPKPGDCELPNFEAKVLQCASQFNEHVAGIKDKAAGYTKDDTTNAAVLCLLHDCWKEAFDVERRIRQQCYKKLPYNPDDASDDNNKYRKCPLCQTIWMKVNGCTGTTTCGARVFEKDNALSLGSCVSSVFPLLASFASASPKYAKGSYSSSIPAKDGEYFQKLEQGKADGAIAAFHKGCHGVTVGCGAEFQWALQPRLPQEQVQAFLVSVDNVHDSSKMVEEGQEKVINKINDNQNRRAAEKAGKKKCGAAAKRMMGKKRKKPEDGFSIANE